MVFGDVVMFFGAIVPWLGSLHDVLLSALGPFFGALAAFGFNWQLHLLKERNEHRGAFGAATHILAQQWNDCYNVNRSLARMLADYRAGGVPVPDWFFTRTIHPLPNATLRQDWNALGFVFASSSGRDVINELTQCEVLHADLLAIVADQRKVALEVQDILASANQDIEQEMTLQSIQKAIGPAKWMQIESMGKALIERWQQNGPYFQTARIAAQKYAKEELGFELKYVFPEQPLPIPR
jgi:hypothetical protein